MAGVWGLVPTTATHAEDVSSQGIRLVFTWHCYMHGLERGHCDRAKADSGFKADTDI